MRIETARLILEVPDPSWAPRVAAYFGRNRERFERWDPPRAEAFRTEDFWRERLAKNASEARSGASVRLFAVLRDEPEGRVAANASLAPIERGPFLTARLGYAVDGALEGQGYMAEVIRALVAHAFGPLGLHRVEANHDPENIRSAQVLKACGFAPIGFARAYLFVGGAWRDHVLNAIVNPAPVEPAR